MVLLDEINICNKIKDIISDKTILGDRLLDNISIIAACNPYKLRGEVDRVGLVIKNREKSRLVYKVNPLQLSLFHYV